MTPQLEICCGDIASVLAARQGGADRIELCCGLAEGGLTPSAALISGAVESGISRVNVLIRPRPGDFLYEPAELAIMASDIRRAIELGANGVVIGALTPDGDIDMELCRQLVGVARQTAGEVGLTDLNITFHRAFDVARDPERSLEEVIALGCDCLLTSGCAPSAAEGTATLARLVNRARGRITIMAGAGVNPSNAAAIAATGVGALHSTARSLTASKMRYRNPRVSMGTPGTDEYSRPVTSPQVVASLLQSLNQSN